MSLAEDDARDEEMTEDAVTDDLHNSGDDDLADREPALPQEDESDPASLDELLAQRAAARRGSDDSDDEAEIMSFASERDEPVLETLRTRTTPLQHRQEFVCNNCHLVKPRVQLADPGRGLCRDCV
jgi:hypothetical protein